jgi:hypothetical protein
MAKRKVRLADFADVILADVSEPLSGPIMICTKEKEGPSGKVRCAEYAPAGGSREENIARFKDKPEQFVNWELVGEKRPGIYFKRYGVYVRNPKYTFKREYKPRKRKGSKEKGK